MRQIKNEKPPKPTQKIVKMAKNRKSAAAEGQNLVLKRFSMDTPKNPLTEKL